MTPNRMSLALFVVCVGVGSFACGDPPVEANDETSTEGDGDGDPGDGDGDGAPGDGDGDPGDGDGDGTPGDGDGDGAPGDGDGAPAECGNGEVEDDEECDDGNDVDEDDCTNACALPACGDGIVSPGAGETCDDGNVASGDACTPSCVLPGTMISEAIVDIGDGTADRGYEVVIDSGDNIAILLESGTAMRLVEFDPDLELVWNSAALVVSNPTLAIGPSDELVIGGRVGTTGSTRKYDTNGDVQWTNTEVNNSWIYSVAVDGQGNVLAAGFEPNNDGVIRHYDPMGASGSFLIDVDAAIGYGPITVDADGQFWAVRRTPRQLENFAANGDPGWNAALPMVDYHELAVDSSGNVYVLGAPANNSMFSLHKFDDTGELLWTADHDDADVLDAATGLTLLPGGAILVAGFTNGSPNSSDGLLVWYDTDGNLFHELVLDGPADEDLDVFLDIAVAPGGDHAVAVGWRFEAGGNDDLWIYKFQI